MENALASLQLADEEEIAFQEEEGLTDQSFHLCLVGRCLTESVVHFPSLRNTLADLWHLIKGIYISDLGERRYLFKFFHEVDIQRVIVGAPWFFNNHLLLLHRIRVSLNVLNPLKRKKKLAIGSDRIVYAKFRYEKLSLFCFICGKLGHGESFCHLRTVLDPATITFGWDIFLRAEVWRRSSLTSQWLREADGSVCGGQSLASFQNGAISRDNGDFVKQPDAMKIVSWNVRGLGRSRTVKRLRNKLRAINPHILFLIETKLDEKSMERVRLKLGFSCGIAIGADGSKGGLSLCWKDNSLVSLRSYSSYHIDVDITDCDHGIKWRLTGFYGNPVESLTAMSWDLLCHLHHNNTGPWLVVGDFNKITSSFEKRGGQLRSESQIAQFRNALEACDLVDMGFSGRWFAWERGRFQATNIRERLDRGVANSDWLDLFHSYSVKHLNYSFSDHCPILIDTFGNHFHESLGEAVRQFWSEPCDNVVAKLTKAGHFFKHWNHLRSRELKRQRTRLEERLNFLQTQVPDDDILEEIMKVQLGLNLEADKEEIFWEQRARVNWLKHGDKNTNFFHRTTISRHHYNRIVGLENEEGDWVTNPDDLLSIAANYFRELFTASESASDHRVLGIVEQRVSAEMNSVLLTPFLESEIQEVVKSMAPLKAPGIDGFPALFFQRYWDIFGSDVSSYCLVVLKGEVDMGEINKTHIVLIPKVDRPKNIAQFRPISLCNVIYKIIAKVLVNRMSTVLGHCINEAQGAFIVGRQISDNTLIAYEILHSLKSRKHCKKGNFALKLDMNKVYDRVEWDFLAGMMSRLGFCQEWIVLIMQCVCSVSYTVGINEGISDVFTPSRGLRQGDPLSPYLFLICTEGLSTLLNEAKQKKSMVGAPIGRERFTVNHLLFADDCILFGDATKEGAHTVRNILNEYEMISGQKNCRLLSMSAKEVFVKAILQAIPIYIMQCFELPKTLCDKLEGIMNKFWWANGKSGKGIHWCSWKDLCLPKSFGGMGFRDLSFFNKALLAKQAWRLLSQPSCLLSKVLKARYFPFSHFLSAKVGFYLSFTWRSICNARDLIADGLIWRIGNGRSVNIWNDPWVLGPGNGRLLIQDISTQWTIVNHLMDDHSFTWKEDIIHRIADHNQARRILKIPLPQTNVDDNLVWHHDNIGEYTVKSGYRVLLSGSTRLTTHILTLVGHYNNFYKTLWELQVELSNNNSDGKDNLVSMFVTTSAENRRVLTITFWALWFTSNKLIHEGRKFSIQDILCFIQKYAWELKLNGANNSLSLPTTTVFWHPPPLGVIKLNFDASFNKDSNSSIAAVIARNDKGLVMGACVYRYVDIVDAFVAEARACERALLFAIDMGFRKIILEGDSLTTIKKVGSNLEDRSVIRPITVNIRKLQKLVEDISYRFIPRRGNRAAHCLAAEGRLWSFPCCWVEEVPSWVNRTVVEDWEDWIRAHD
ncbi:non-ltr retroelement reverse transcriptase [Gossypium australe]|uniref:Non-ltr retroelement reverse transcriptase n=1 Tax=Gossypium australe TaxID=47621 RepID=A0A5B6V1B5_9ROSI|nr:non-ltr retroelement reverse transcriptase [Gossypium australe]